MRDPRARAGRQAALLFGVGAGRAGLGLFTRSGTATATLVLLGFAYLTLAVVTLFVPWARLARWASLLLALPAFVLMAAFGWYGLVPQAALSVPFMISFAWVGANHQRGTSLGLAPFAALALAVPMAHASDGFDVRALLLVLGGCVTVAETIAYVVHSAVEGHARAERAARAFGVVARASAGLHDLDAGRVLDAVPDAVVDLGYDGARLVMADQARVADGVVGEAWSTGQPLVADGPPVAVAVPVFVRRTVVAVLLATSAGRRAVLEEEVEALRILAATAGAALENAQQFLAERTSAEAHAAAALTDPLTGVGNRRYAHHLLDELRPGDTVVMVDLDHFKDVNDQLGHAAGDEVLRELATHLVGSLREEDEVARFGGEEFLVVLRGTELPRAELTVGRVLDGWRRTGPRTTFSAGVAHHVGGAAEATLERADQALYAAKAAGRDTVRAAEPLVDLPAPRRPRVPSTVVRSG